jgi:hypothetical protein
MTNLQEFNARAALCRQLARLEPDSKNIWLAEADRWSHLTQEPGAATATRRAEPAGTWCWEVMPKRKHRALKAAGVQFELPSVAKPADKDPFEEFLSDMSRWDREPN